MDSVSLPASVAHDLNRISPGRVYRDANLAELSRWKIGGRAAVIVRPTTTEELANIRTYIWRQGLTSTVIGATTNLLFSDDGLRCVCIQIGENFADMTISGTDVLAGPGVWIPGLARKALNAGLTGAEHICGVPSTLGGLVCMNGGTQRKGIGDAVVTVESVDREGHLTTRTADQCGFAYRTSAFQSNDEVIGQVRLRFRPALDVRAVRQEMLSILRSRKARFPKRLPNCGSVFVSNPAMYEAFGPPGALIEALGFKGIVEGGAQVSNQHANFINNLGGATAKDVLTLIHRIKQAVLDHTGYEMRAEARFVAPDGRMMPADAKEVWLG